MNINVHISFDHMDWKDEDGCCYGGDDATIYIDDNELAKAIKHLIDTKRLIIKGRENDKASRNECL